MVRLSHMQEANSSHRTQMDSSSGSLLLPILFGSIFLFTESNHFRLYCNRFAAGHCRAASQNRRLLSFFLARLEGELEGRNEIK